MILNASPILSLRTFLLCPVPEEQKPITQYLELKEKKLLSSNTIAFFVKLVNQWKISNYGFSIHIKLRPQFMLLKFVIQSIVNIFFGSFLFVFFFFDFFFCFFDCKKVQKNLTSSFFFYEEASWYDTNLWYKPLFVIKNDRLIQTQQNRFFFSIPVIYS